MTRKIDLGEFPWSLAGWTPNLWQFETAAETGQRQKAEIPSFPIEIPCSVQAALLRRGMIPDMYTGFQARLFEWVEYRHWSYECRFECDPVPGHRYELVLPGVDAAGWVRLDGKMIGTFKGAHREHRLGLPSFAGGGGRGHLLEIIFDSPVRFAGQFGRTSQMPVDKPRFYYGWDWIPRLVQTALTQTPYLLDLDAPGWELEQLRSGVDSLFLQGVATGVNGLTIALYDGETLLREQDADSAAFVSGIELGNLPVAPWHPNLAGEQKLYTLRISGEGVETRIVPVGFKQVRWLPCEGAAPGADPWICEVNGNALFLQGVNWTPIRAFYADIPQSEYRKRLELYRDMGCNLLRVWGGASLEPDFFYAMCDELGLMVWQEFPMSSSGVENVPPSDPEAMREMEQIASHYLKKLPRHVSLLAWSGGNELQRNEAGEAEGCGLPCTTAEPMLAMLEKLVERGDPGRRFMATSASGPFEFGDEAHYGRGELWDVHGPWKWDGALENGWFAHWDGDDSLFRSEFGCPGASPAELIRRHAGEEPVFPCSSDTPWWRYPLDWWSEHEVFEKVNGRPPAALEEYVQWSQARQAEALSYAVKSMKSRFPRCGGAILWMGHDSFPCAANTSLIDFDGNPKPAVAALRELFHAKPGSPAGRML